MPPADPQAQSQQPDLDIVAHPVLGPLKFPKDMGPDERNQIIQQHMAEYKANLPQAPASGSIAPPLTSPWEATKYGLKEFGGGLADVGKGIYNTIKPPDENSPTDERAAAVGGPMTLVPYRIGKGLVGLGRQAMQVPGAIRDLAHSPDPMGTLALTAPRVGGQAAGTMIAQKAPEIAAEAPIGRMGRAVWGGAKEAALSTPIVGPMARAFGRGAMEAWRGPEPPAPRTAPVPPLQWNTRTQEPIPNRMATPPPLRWGKTPGRTGPGAGPNAPVTFVPEPRTPFAGEEPNYMASVPRSKLGKMALSRKPGAGTQMQQLGQPIIYIPGEADVPPPRR